MGSHSAADLVFHGSRAPFGPSEVLAKFAAAIGCCLRAAAASWVYLHFGAAQIGLAQRLLLAGDWRPVVGPNAAHGAILSRCLLVYVRAVTNWPRSTVPLCQRTLSMLAARE